MGSAGAHAPLARNVDQFAVVLKFVVFFGVTRQFGVRGSVVSGTKRTNTSAVIQFYNASYSTAAAGDGLGFKV